MIEATLTDRLPASLWVDLPDDMPTAEDVTCSVEIEETAPNQFCLHTFIDGQGAYVTYQFDRESLIGLAARMLKAATLT